VPLRLDVSGLQSRSQQTANGRARRQEGRLSQIASSTGQFCWHPPPEPLALATPEGMMREMDPSRDPAWHP